MKICSMCKEAKPWEEFGKNKSEKDGRMRQCRKCNNSRVGRYFREVRAGTPEYILLGKNRNIRRHGLTVDSYMEMYNSQKGKCNICVEDKVLVIDHDHSCCPGTHGCSKCVRGLICGDCNRALGMFKDSPKLLRRAIKYLDGGPVPK